MNKRSFSKIKNEIVDQFNVKRLKLNKIEGKQKEIEETIMQLKTDYNELNWTNRLPDELITQIFSGMQITELMACEQVCRRWNKCVRDLSPNRAVYFKIAEPRPIWWRHSSKECGFNTMVYTAFFSGDRELSKVLQTGKFVIVASEVHENAQPIRRSSKR